MSARRRARCASPSTKARAPVSRCWPNWRASAATCSSATAASWIPWGCRRPARDRPDSTACHGLQERPGLAGGLDLPDPAPAAGTGASSPAIAMPTTVLSSSRLAPDTSSPVGTAPQDHQSSSNLADGLQMTAMRALPAVRPGYSRRLDPGDLCDCSWLACQGLAFGGATGRGIARLPECAWLSTTSQTRPAAWSWPGSRAGRGRRTGLMLSAFHACRHRPPGHDPGDLGGEQRPITDGHRVRAAAGQRQVRGIGLDLVGRRRARQPRHCPELGSDPCWPEATRVIRRRGAVFHPGHTASTLPWSAARHRHTVPRTDRRKAAFATSARCHRRRRWPAACRPG